MVVVVQHLVVVVMMAAFTTIIFFCCGMKRLSRSNIDIAPHADRDAIMA